MEPDPALAQKALRNTRALIERLETDEATRGRRQKRALAIIAAVALAPVVGAAIWAWRNPNETEADKRQRDCKVQAWSAKSTEVAERLRAASPGMPYTEIAKSLKKEEETFMETAKVTCEGTPAPAPPSR
jgi:hypothetical protein